MISVFCISHVPALLNLELAGAEPARNLLLFAFLVIVVQSSDVLQYVWGKLIGKRLIAPKLSPSKTVEGFIGGVLSASALGAVLWWLTPFTPWQAFGISLGQPDGVLGWPGDVGDQARSRHQGLGPHDRGPRRHARSAGFGVLRRTGVFPPGALLLERVRGRTE